MTARHAEAWLRQHWGSPCAPQLTTLDFSGGGRASLDRRGEPVWAALDAIFRRWDYRTRQADTGGFNCRRIRGGGRWSGHAFGTDLDVNWTTNPYGPVLVTDMPTGMITEVRALRCGSVAPLRWGGDFTSVKDTMHFELMVTPAEIAHHGIHDPGAHLPAPTPIPAVPVSIPTPEEDEVSIDVVQVGEEVWLIAHPYRIPVAPEARTYYLNLARSETNRQYRGPYTWDRDRLEYHPIASLAS
jgi:hypothetical protein